MALVKKPRTTEKRKATSQRNGSLSRGPASCERAAEFASYSVEAVRARRLFDAHLREARRLTDLLLKIQGQERSRPTRKAGG